MIILIGGATHAGKTAYAQKLLEKALDSFEAEVNRFVDTYGLKLKQNQFDALVSFSYNCGTGWMQETTGYFNQAVRSGSTGSAFLYGICLFSKAGGEYILINRRLAEANIIYAYDANEGLPVPTNFKTVPVGKNSDGSLFAYTFQGWFTSDGKKLSTMDKTPANGSVIYARWADPKGNVVELPKGETVNLQVTVTGSGINVRSGPATY